MKTLVLSDEVFAELLAASEGTPLGDRLRSAGALELPGHVELHRMARSGETPDAFTLARLRLEAMDDGREAMKEALHDLIHAAYSDGVTGAVLARWSGYSRTRVHQILDNGTEGGEQ